MLHVELGVSRDIDLRNDPGRDSGSSVAELVVDEDDCLDMSGNPDYQIKFCELARVRTGLAKQSADQRFW